jgi:hypothetical protein
MVHGYTNFGRGDDVGGVLQDPEPEKGMMDVDTSGSVVSHISFLYKDLPARRRLRK